MHKFFVNQNQINNNMVRIIGDDVNHLKNVLRIKEEQKIDICNIDTNITYRCKIEELNDNDITCSIIQVVDIKTESDVEIHIFQGLPKADKMELIIQKSVELGAKKIFPVAMKRCIVKFDEKTTKKKINRWQEISKTASEQSKRDMIPTVENLINVNEICNLIKNYDIMLLAYEEEKTNFLKEELKKLQGNKKLKIGIIIGPEGGLEPEEAQKLKENGAKVITLGNRILRTETVALILTGIIMYELGDIGGNK